jgi:Legionella pneumophila major outer membrane protein precursor
MKRARWLAGMIAVLAGTMSARAQSSDTEPAKPLVMVRLLTSQSTASPSPDLDTVHEERAGCSGGLVLGASFYWMRPYSENNTAYRTNVGLGGLSPQTDTTNFRWNMVPGFAIWGGYTLEDGLGMRGRWFHLDAASNSEYATLGSPGAITTSITASPNLPALPLPPGAGTFGSPGLLLNTGLGRDLLDFKSTLRIDAADAVVTWTSIYGNWKFILGGGGRYLHMDQNYTARLSNHLADNVTSESQVISFNHNFDGGGPVVDLQTNFKVANTNFSFYGLGRGSLLVGQSHQITTYNQNVNDPKGLTNGGFFPVVSAVTPSVINYTDNVLPVAEVELGLEYGRTWGRSHFFTRSAVVSQTYFGAGNATRIDGNLSLFGFQWSAGINY